jgi:hypothetical protein
MKAFVSLTILTLFFQAALATEPIAVSTETAKEMEQLLASMISQADAQKCYALAYPGHQHPAKPTAETEEAASQMTKYKEDRLKIRALTKVGTSILAYPGLLAHGEIHYDFSRVNPFSSIENQKPSEPVYRLFVGLFRYRGKGPENFDIVFGSDGVIREIRTITSKY